MWTQSGLLGVKNFSGMWGRECAGRGAVRGSGMQVGPPKPPGTTLPLAFLAGASLLRPHVEDRPRGREAWITSSRVGVLPGFCSPTHPLCPERACFSLFFKSPSFLPGPPTLAGVQA